MQLIAIPGAQLATYWANMLPGLSKLLDKGIVPYEPDEISAGIQDGTWILFAMVPSGRQSPPGDILERFPAAYFICRISSRVFEVGLCWGKGLAWWGDTVLTGFEKVARECGCHRLSVGGRPGWAKIGKRYGFKPKSITIVKEL